MIVQAISDFTPELLKEFTGIGIYATKTSEIPVEKVEKNQNIVH